MEKSRAEESLMQHPGLIAGVFAVLAAMAALNAFRTGMACGQFRHAVAEQARAASEALGG